MLYEELLKTASSLPTDLYIAANAIEESNPLSAYRITLLARILCVLDDARGQIDAEMKRMLADAYRAAANEFEKK